MKGIWSAILAMTLGLESWVTPALAANEDDARIVVITDHADAAIIPLLRAELNQLGLQVIEVEKRTDEIIPRDLTETARQHHAVAAFRVQVSSNTVEVWIADRVSGKVSLREVFTQGSDSRVEARLVVLQAVELLRWSLQEVDAPRPLRGQGSSPPPTLARLTDYPLEDPLMFGVAPLFMLSPGGASPGAGAQLDMTVRWSWVGTRFAYGQLVLPAILETAAGRAELTTRWFAVEGVALGSASKRRLRPSLGLGIAMISTSMHGISSPPRLATDDSLFSVAPIVDGKLAYWLGRHVQLTLGANLMTPFRSDALYFEGQQVGTYGKLFVSVALGIQVGIP
jgi:hypothetical protein